MPRRGQLSRAADSSDGVEADISYNPFDDAQMYSINVAGGTDSGLDLDAVRAMATSIAVALREGKPPPIRVPSQPDLGDDAASTEEAELAGAPPADQGGVPADGGPPGPYVAITTPISGSRVGQTFELAGRARAFEAQIVVEVSRDGNVNQRHFVRTSNGAPNLGTWSLPLALEPGTYRIEAFEQAPDDEGTRLAPHVIWINVR